jgi:hypothetical protein
MSNIDPAIGVAHDHFRMRARPRATPEGSVVTWNTSDSRTWTESG